VNIRQAFSHNELSTPKGTDDRSVPMAALLRGIVAEAAKGKKPTDFLVQDEGGRTPSRQKLYKAFIALQKRLHSPSTATVAPPSWRKGWTTRASARPAAGW
jgi:hypothetical protein